ncbi:hypothetical protein B0H12DRAFT_1133663 [Mycena haematopus]|nr:hypothetical protein B0H12DRAFT_1133663 [Mycena haematopus]
MAFFENSHGIQINGGLFYNVAGSMTIDQQLSLAPDYQPHLIRAQDDSHPGRTSRVLGGTEISHPSVGGSQRSVRDAGRTRHRPYGTSGRRKISLHLPQLPVGRQFTAVWPSGSDTTEDKNSSEHETPESSPHFEYEPTTTINGGTFVSNNTRREGERGIDLLHSAVALAALHDSVESFPQPKCHPETRTEILQDLHDWSTETGPESTVLWLYGPAGAGKSAIMQTFARELQSAGRLGGSFFFKRGHATRGDGKRIFTTIAYQLALGVSWLKGPISRVVEEDPSIIARSIETQLQKLISEPCRLHNVDANADGRPAIIVVVDGLDECDGPLVQEEILRAIRNSTSLHCLPLRYIIASRPEPHICELFDTPLYRGGYRSFNVEQSFEDVRKYLCDEFYRIHREHRTMASIPSPWPSAHILEKLVLKSSGHFIYASTVIKFIDDKNYKPTERLTVVIQDGKATESESDSAFEALDQLYMTILSSAPRQAQLPPVLCAIANFDFHPEMLDRLLGLDNGNARLLLRGLHSVLCIPDEVDDYSHAISSYHASFLDFLDNQKRSGNFYIGGSHHRMELARSLLGLFAGEFQTYIDLCGDWGSRSPLSLISLLISLPPCVELVSLIQRMNPDYVFELWPNVKGMLPWLKKIPRVPDDLVNLWEDYEYMSFCVETICTAKSDPTPNTMSLFFAQDIVQVAGLLRLLQVLLLVDDATRCLRQIRLLLGVTWDDLKTTICALRSLIGRDDKAMRELANHVLDGSFFGEAYPWPSLSRDLARRLIRIVSVCDRPYKRTIFSLSFSLSYLVRSSPSCPNLLSDLWTILPLQIWDDLHSVECYIYHVSKWLELFPDPPLELLTFWRQSLRDARPISEIVYSSESASATHHIWENDWRMYANPRGL